MNQATWNFRLDTLMHEIEMHEHKDELIQLLREQVEDMYCSEHPARP